jgi:hypothetical protein
MALEAILNLPGAYRVVLEEYPEGVYFLVFETPESEGPCIDNLQDNWGMAKMQGKEDFGIAKEAYHEIPDTHFNG